MIFILNAMVILRSDKIWQYFIIRPASTALRCPIIIIGTIATDINHGINCRGTTQTFTTWLITFTSIQSFLWNGFKSPVVNFGRQTHDTGCRNIYCPGIALPTCFQKTDRNIGIFTETAGQYASCAPSTNNDVVKFLLHCYCSIFIIIFST